VLAVRGAGVVSVWGEDGGAGRKRFFFEKKNQKTFYLRRMLPARYAQIRKSFLLLFFKKEALISLMAWFDSPPT
jgi:hypothetical protein